jgi:hypothetical protein
MSIPPERRAVLKILPPELVAALNQPVPDAERRALINRVVSDEVVRIQALRYVEELRLAEQADDADAPTAPAGDDPADR